MEQYWLITIIIVLLIFGIVFDGVRRIYKARRDSIKMSLRPVSREDEMGPLDEYGSEFPNGGARVSDNLIDPERIQKVRNKYNFGGDIPAWREKVANKIAQHTGMKVGEPPSSKPSSPRVEPFVHSADDELGRDLYDSSLNSSDSNNQDPLMDNVYGENVYGENVHAENLRESYQEHEVEIGAIPDSAEIHKPVQTSFNLDTTIESAGECTEAHTGEGISQGYNTEAVIEQESDVQSIRSVATHIDTNADADAEKAVETHSANKPRYESKYVDHAKTVSDGQRATSREVPTVTDVLVIHVKAPKGDYLYGSDLLELILNNSLRFGEMDIFHRHTGADGEGPVLFSMANIVKPGTFNLQTFENFSTVGLSFFLTLPTPLDNHMEALEIMLAAAKDIANTLGGELNDEQRSVLTGQTIEHYRERIRDFSRRQQLEKNKS